MVKTYAPVRSAVARSVFLLLGVPSVGLSLSLTVLSTYLPLLARQTSGLTGADQVAGGSSVQSGRGVAQRLVQRDWL